jgi:hypothetical protein
MIAEDDRWDPCSVCALAFLLTPAQKRPVMDGITGLPLMFPYEAPWRSHAGPYACHGSSGRWRVAPRGKEAGCGRPSPRMTTAADSTPGRRRRVTEEASMLPQAPPPYSPWVHSPVCHACGQDTVWLCENY